MKSPHVFQEILSNVSFGWCVGMGIFICVCFVFVFSWGSALHKARKYILFWKCEVRHYVTGIFCFTKAG